MARTGRHSDSTRNRALVVAADTTLSDTLRARLNSDEFSVQVALTVRGAWSAYQRVRPDVVLLDIDSTGPSGWGLLDQIRAHDSVPVMIASERSHEHDVAAALERGADDYLTKPLALDEVMARIRVRLRRAPRHELAAENSLSVGELEIDVSQRRVLRAGRFVHLTPTEYALLREFARYADKLLTERMLHEAIWGARPVNSHLLQVYIARLRQKLEVNPAVPAYLVTEPGSGYRLATRRR